MGRVLASPMSCTLASADQNEMTTPLINRTVGQIVRPDGRLATLPTVIIGADAAAILRNYFSWALSQQLEPELFCATCYDGTRESKAVYNITEQEIEIVCGCSIRFFKGTWLPPVAVAAATSHPSENAEPTIMRLSADCARLLRLYKKVLMTLGLKEALRCNACYNLNLNDGCEAQVLTQSIRITCRCSDRRYWGLSI